MSAERGALRQMAALGEELARRTVLDFLRQQGRRDAWQIASGTSLPYAVAVGALDDLVRSGAVSTERLDGTEFFRTV